jgi:hypothetical protein
MEGSCKQCNEALVSINGCDLLDCPSDYYLLMQGYISKQLFSSFVSCLVSQSIGWLVDVLVSWSVHW